MEQSDTLSQMLAPPEPPPLWPTRSSRWKARYKEDSDDKTDFSICQFCNKNAASYECKEGHKACSSCYEILKKKCTICLLPGCNRDGSITAGRMASDLVKIEVTLAECKNKQFGCNKIMRATKKSSHEEKCPQTLCFCPFSKCNFANSYMKLAEHVMNHHALTQTLDNSKHSFPILPLIPDLQPIKMVQQQQPSRSKATQEFLSRVLSSSSRYDEEMKSVISQHLMSLKEANPFMVLGTKKFISEKRKPPILLQARLNIPMVYQNVTYYLPVAFWLTELYPRYAPLVCVYPTPDMVRKRDHPFVNPHGFVTIDYLQNWVYPTCNLVDLCPKLSEAFALDPPLYSKARPDPPNPHCFNTSPSVKSNSEQPKPSSSSTLVPHGEGDRISDRVFALVEECKKQREALMSASPLLQDGLRMTDGEGLEQQLDRVLKIANVLRSLVLSGAAVEGVDNDLM